MKMILGALIYVIGVCNVFAANPTTNPPVSYGVNFAGRIHDKPANIFGVFGPEGAKQDNWNNVVAPKNVNSNSPCNFSVEITDNNGGNPITLTIKDNGVDGGNDGGGGPITNNFQRLFHSGIRDGSSSWDITTSVAPFGGTYDVYIYSGNSGRSYGVNSGTTTNWRSEAAGTADEFVEGKNYRIFTGLTGPLRIHFADAIEGFSIVDPNANVALANDTKIYDIPFNDIEGKPTSLKTFEGKVILVVNVASKSGFTPQYKGLEALYQKYKEQGLVVLGFPCNDFGSQEPTTNAEIKAFANEKYGVTFPLMDKIHAKGQEQHPLYAEISGPRAAFPGDVKWNFGKFLIARDGKIIARYAPATNPIDENLVKAIEAELARKPPKPDTAKPALRK